MTNDLPERSVSTHAHSGVVKAGVPTAADMYDQHYAAVLRYVRARVPSREAAEDLAGDVFCKAVAGLGSYKPIRGSALPWLYTIAAHRVADYYRSAKPTTGLEAVRSVADGSANPGDVVAARDLVRRVWELSKSLPESQQRALWLRYGEELEHREIAARMGRSVEAVKLLVHRAVRGIRNGLAAAEVTALAEIRERRAVPAATSSWKGRERLPIGSANAA